MNAFTWIEAKTAEQAVAELSSERGGPALLKAGGVDVLDRLKEGLETPERLVNISRLGAGMREILVTEAKSVPPLVTKLLPSDKPGGEPTPRDCLKVGALATLAQVASHPQITQLLPALSAAASGAATPQVRQLATVGGNLMQRPRCWYFRSAEYQCLKKGGGECFAREGENDFHSIFDNRVCSAVHPSALATALWALDAVVLITGPQGERSARLSALLVSASQPGGDVRRENKLAPDEIITALYVPMPKANERNVYLKLKQKQSFDWPLVEVAVAVRMSQKPGALFEAARVVLGSVAPTPWRAKAAEAALLKLQSGDAAALLPVGQAAVEGATPMQKNGYKVAIAQALVQRAVAELLANRGH